MKQLSTLLLFLVVCMWLPGQEFRPPSVPLIAHDPYFSIWSPGNKLTDKNTVHWTGKRQSLGGLIRIDGKVYRVIGAHPSSIEPLKQKSLAVYPTRTAYEFENRQVNLILTFLTPALPSDLDLLSRPVTYLTWQIKTVDGKNHDVEVYFDCTGEIAVNDDAQKVIISKVTTAGLKTLKIGSVDQPILQKKGDNLRIDWGYAYLSAPENEKTQSALGHKEKLEREFIKNGALSGTDVNIMPMKVSDDDPTMALSWKAENLNENGVTFRAMIAYDDLYSIRYFAETLLPWWKRNGETIESVLVKADADYAQIEKKCTDFDTELMKDLEAAGGEKYAKTAALAYRQCLAAHKLAADKNGMPLIFAKENFSNGCIATVDVIYPTSPFFLLFSPALAKAMLQSNFDYAASAKWKFPFAPHDLGTYPFATGQVYGGAEETEENQMPVEETGNMILMTAALAKLEGNADFAKIHWPVIEKWCGYLLSKGFDPENQLCTDDFAGHLAHNINLSAKAIEAIGAYSMLCRMTGDTEKAAEIRKKAETMAKMWVEQATEGDHTKLAYDQSGTWSQKYNLVWDKIIGLNLFPKEIIQKEIEYYKTVQSEFGLPLDSRERYTKNDWITWTATLAYSKEDFETLFNPVYDFANKTPDRVPLCDWYNTDNAFQKGFQARSVVGGFFIKLLDNPETWAKYVKQGADVNGKWAPIEFIPPMQSILPTAKEQSSSWKYTFGKPAAGWSKLSFADADWKEGKACFGSETFGNSATIWNTDDIWLRKTFEVKEVSEKQIALQVLHDDDAEIYINGICVASLNGANGTYDVIPLIKKAKNVLKPGKNIIAVHCKNTGGEQFIDVGIAEY